MTSIWLCLVFLTLTEGVSSSAVGQRSKHTGSSGSLSYRPGSRDYSYNMYDAEWEAPAASEDGYRAQDVDAIERHESQEDQSAAETVDIYDISASETSESVKQNRRKWVVDEQSSQVSEDREADGRGSDELEAADPETGESSDEGRFEIFSYEIGGDIFEEEPKEAQEDVAGANKSETAEDMEGAEKETVSERSGEGGEDGNGGDKKTEAEEAEKAMIKMSMVFTNKEKKELDELVSNGNASKTVMQEAKRKLAEIHPEKVDVENMDEIREYISTVLQLAIQFKLSMHQVVILLKQRLRGTLRTTVTNFILAKDDPKVAIIDQLGNIGEREATIDMVGLRSIERQGKSLAQFLAEVRRNVENETSGKLPEAMKKSIQDNLAIEVVLKLMSTYLRRIILIELESNLESSGKETTWTDFKTVLMSREGEVSADLGTTTSAVANVEAASLNKVDDFSIAQVGELLRSIRQNEAVEQEVVSQLMGRVSGAFFSGVSANDTAGKKITSCKTCLRFP